LNIKNTRDDQVTSALSSFISLLLVASVTVVTVASTPAFAKKTNNKKSSEKSINRSLDSDKDGLSDAYEKKIGTESFLADTDGDGLSDGVEVGKNLKKPFNHDGDRLIDALDPDDDNDGLPTILEIQLSSDSDIDDDGIKNYLDPDSDNDGVNDGIEAGMLGKDTNFDRIDDAFDAQQKGAKDKNGDGIADTIFLPDHNKDGIVDMFDKTFQYVKKESNKNPAPKMAKKPSKDDLKSAAVVKVAEKTKKEKAIKLSKKELKKKAEQKIKKEELELAKAEKKLTKKSKPKKPKKLVINKNTDTDNDGLLDTLEIVLGTNIKKRDSDGDTVSDAIEIGIDPKHPQDSDHDGIIDALDPDDDNDGVLTKNEDINKDGSPINDDTDDDGVPNYLDGNDDGDRRLTIAEGSTKDMDKDGILDYLDNNDAVANFSVGDKKIIKTPDVVVLKESNPKDFENKPFQEYPAAVVATDESTHLNKTARITHSLEQAIESSKKKSKQEFTSSNNGVNGKLAKKKQVSLRNKDESFMTWITSLLPK